MEGEMFGREGGTQAADPAAPGQTYSGDLQEASNKRIADRLASFGYAFANVTANPESTARSAKSPSPSSSIRASAPTCAT
jgi:outer membrane protein assembly factor BamA